MTLCNTGSCIFKVLTFKAISVFQFPYCDGAHNAHNEETGDNIGPVCIQRKKK
jgi:hypothetical protein